MAMIIVVLTIVALAILATPFLVSMRLQERVSRRAVAETQARYAVAAAMNHALGRLLYAASHYGEFAVSFDDLPPEFGWRKGDRWVQPDASVEDEQAKINVNTAPEPLLTDLLADADLNLGVTRAAAEQLAAALVSYRTSAGPFLSLDSLRRDELFTDAQIDALRPHLTVHSLTEQEGLGARVNINDASIPVLRSLLSGVRMRLVRPTADTANTGTGRMSLVELTADVEGTWEVRCTDVTTDPDTGATTFAFVVESYPEDDPTDRTERGTSNLVEYPHAPAGATFSLEGVAFSVYNGTTDFAPDDKFTFSAERFSFIGDTFLPDKVNLLLKRFRARVVSADPAAGTLRLDDASTFPLTGWVRVRGDAIRYTGVAGNTLQGCSDFAVTPVPGDTVALVVAGLDEFAARLAEAVSDGDLIESERAALLANAKNADTESDEALLLDGTAAFCFEPSGRYTIEAWGAVHDKSGSAVETVCVRRVIALEHGDNAVWSLDTQADFDRELAARAQDGLITFPEHSYLADIAPSREPLTEPGHGLRLAPIIEPGYGWAFDGPTSLGMGDWVGTHRAPCTADASFDLAPGTKGVLVTDALGFRAFAAATSLAVDDGLRRLVAWVKPSDEADSSFAYNAEHVFFETAGAGSEHQNRIRLFYAADGALVFRVADEAAEPRSAEVRAAISPAEFSRGVWHRIEALWSGMAIDRMALLLDGRRIGSYGPSGPDAERRAVPDLDGERWIARVAHHLVQEGQADPVRDTQAGTTSSPTSVYGYGACRFINKDASERDTEFNKVHRGGAAVGAGFGTRFVTALHIPVTDPPTPPENRKVTAAATVIPVVAPDDFPDAGHIKIDDEIIHYTEKSAAQTDAGGNTYYELTVADDGRGQDLGDNLATRYTTDPAEHDHGATVLCISVPVSSNNDYPMPHLLDVPADVENYFGLSDLDPNLCYVQIDDEWIGYTHRAGTEFLVNAQARSAPVDPEDPGAGNTSSMRAAAGTELAAHVAGRPVLPVYEVTAGGRTGPGDRVSLLDDDLAPAAYNEEAVKHAANSRYGYVVSFADFLPAGLDIYVKRGDRIRNARMVKFPSGRFRPQRLVAIGAPVSGAGARADSFLGPVRLLRHTSSNCELRLKHAVTDGTGSLILGRLDSIYNGGTEWAWADRDFGVGSWPLTTYVQLGDEAVLAKVRYPHNIGYSAELGAVSRGASTRVHEDIPATGNIVWTRQGAEEDPIELGFNPHGGYVVVISYTRTQTSGTTKTLENCTDELVQWLLDQGHITQADVDNGTKDPETGLWSFPPITTEGGWVTSEKREFVFYREINPKTPGAGQYTFTCEDAGRHLYDTHKDGEGNPLGHSVADDGEGGQLYPTLHARTAELAILQRGGAPGNLDLGSARADHPAGTAVLPLPNLPATVLYGPPLDENGDPAGPYEGDRLPVEDTAHFPPSGYVEITDAAGNREILYYTGKEEVPVEGADPLRKRYYLIGVRRFRGRFGTLPIDLTGLTGLDDVRNTSDAHLTALRDPRRTARLFHPRFHDRMPLAITVSGGAETERVYAPLEADEHVLCFETQKTVRGAKWLSVDWTEELAPGTDIVVLARVGEAPDWGTGVPVKWDAVPAGAGRVIYKFDAPKTHADDNALNAESDTLTLRVFFKFNPAYDLSGWAVPVLKSLTVRYEANPRAVESQKLEF
jgi:hypothetical protein